MLLEWLTENETTLCNFRRLCRVCHSVFDDSKEGTLWRRSLVDTIVSSRGAESTLADEVLARVRLLQKGVRREAGASAGTATA